MRWNHIFMHLLLLLQLLRAGGRSFSSCESFQEIYYFAANSTLTLGSHSLFPSEICTVKICWASETHLRDPQTHFSLFDSGSLSSGTITFQIKEEKERERERQENDFFFEGILLILNSNNKETVDKSLLTDRVPSYVTIMEVMSWGETLWVNTSFNLRQIHYSCQTGKKKKK